MWRFIIILYLQFYRFLRRLFPIDGFQNEIQMRFTSKNENGQIKKREEKKSKWINRHTRRKNEMDNG